MTNLPTSWRLMGAVALTAGTVLVALGGCGEEEPPPVAAAPPPRPAAPPPPPKPTVTPIADLMVQFRIDERIILPEDKAPDNDPDRIAVLQFFDAFARGDQTTAGEMMTLADRMELDALVENGSWDRTVAEIEMIEIQTGASEFGDCALAVFTVGMDFQPQLWYYEGDESAHTFEAAPSPPGILDRLSGTDWIKAWHDILAEELALANRPDEEVDVPQQNLDNAPAGDGSSQPNAQPSSPGFNPASSPPGFGRRQPPGRKRRAPGPRG
jgi:hypothetical protein